MQNSLLKICLIIGVVLVLSSSAFPIENGKCTQSTPFDNVTINEKSTPSGLLTFRWKPKDVIIRFNETITNEGDYSIDIDTYLAQPCSMINQEIKGPIIYNPLPDGFETDRWGQKVASYTNVLAPGQAIELSWEVNATIYTVRSILLPWKMRGTISEEIQENYLADDSKYHINDPYIQNIVHEVVGNTKNILQKAKKLHDYITQHLEFYDDGVWDDAITTLRRGNGSCSEYTFAYIALCRAAGIPAQYIGGTRCREDAPYVDSSFHRIAEIYLPYYGWIPVDAQGDDGSRYKYYCFGSYNNRFLVLTVDGGLSEYLDWDYISWHTILPQSENVKINRSVTWLQWDNAKLLRP